MNRSFFQKIEIIVVIGCVLLLQICCQERLQEANASRPGSTESKPALSEPKPQSPVSAAPLPQKQEPVKTETTVQVRKPGPEITFESLIHDFGEVGVTTKNTCEFKFKNTGDALLRISKVHAPCGCTVPTLTKKEFAPGESGILTVIFRASSKSGTATKRLYVHSNDKARPKLGLTIKAKIVMKVEHEPERLNLLLKGENAGCPDITLTSRDKRPFTITSFTSTGGSITADFDPAVKSPTFVLKPKLDIEKLRKGPKGHVEIGLTHPGCNKVSIVFDALPEFKIEPRVVYVRNAEPGKPETKEVWVFSNYNEAIEVESVSSKKDTIKVLTQEKDRNGYKFEFQIIPPAASSKGRVFTDVLTINLKGGQQLQLTCYGVFSKTPVNSSQ